jgi:hypothetical protein
MYCPECGGDHHAGERQEQTAADREIEIARINADRDINVARINARVIRNELDTAETIAETEGEAQVETAAAEAAVLGEILNATGDQEPEPLIIDAPPAPEPEPDPTDDAAPPPAEHHEDDDDKPRKRGLGMW